MKCRATPCLPDDLPAIIGSLAAIHALPVPPASARAPLRDHADPVGETLREIAAQAAHLDAADLSTDARRAIDEELAWAAEFQLDSGRPPVTLISSMRIPAIS